jgi:hypothetical protein
VIRIILLLVSTVIISFQVDAQVITEQNWQTEADFRAVEDNVKQSIIWLEENPMSTVSNDTKAITSYVLNWLSNAPYLSVTYDEVFLEGLANKKYKFAEKFRVTYLLGKSYYVITHQEGSDSTEVKASARGIEGMVKVYHELKKIDPSVKHKVLEKYSRLLKQAKLDSYAATQLAKPTTDSF